MGFEEQLPKFQKLMEEFHARMSDLREDAPSPEMRAQLDELLKQSKENSGKLTDEVKKAVEGVNKAREEAKQVVENAKKIVAEAKEKRKTMLDATKGPLIKKKRPTINPKLGGVLRERLLSRIRKESEDPHGAYFNDDPDADWEDWAFSHGSGASQANGGPKSHANGDSPHDSNQSSGS